MGPDFVNASPLGPLSDRPVTAGATRRRGRMSLRILRTGGTLSLRLRWRWRWRGRGRVALRSRFGLSWVAAVRPSSGQSPSRSTHSSISTMNVWSATLLASSRSSAEGVLSGGAQLSSSARIWARIAKSSPVSSPWRCLAEKKRRSGGDEGARAGTGAGGRGQRV